MVGVGIAYLYANVDMVKWHTYNIDRYANQVVHAGVGGIAGPVSTSQYHQPRYPEEEELY